MKTIGLIGGMSWESTTTYYSLINREMQKRLGGMHSARILLHSFDFDDIATLQHAGQWAEAQSCLVAAGVGLTRAGADFLVICTNTMHIAARAIEKGADISVLHIADPLGEAICSAGLKRVGLLGTQFTMEKEEVLRGRLTDKYGLSLLAPEGEEAREVNRIIYDELVRGKFLDSSRARCRSIIAGLVAQGAQGIILGCTELPLLIKPEDSTVPLFDTTTLHALAAVDWALERP